MVLKKFLKKSWKRIQSPFRRSHVTKTQVVISRPMNVQKDGDPLASMMNLAENQEYFAREGVQSYELSGALQGHHSSTASSVANNSGEEGAIRGDDRVREQPTKTSSAGKNHSSET